MKAVAVTGERKIEILDLEKPLPKSNEIQIKIKACALCTWEQRVYFGEKKVPYPLIGGHEIAGEISALGDEVNPEKYILNTPVVVRIIGCCNHCYYCRHGMENLCPSVNTFPLNGPQVYGMGGLAEYLCVDVTKVWFYNNGVSWEKIVLTEPLACIMHSLRIAHLKPGDDIVIIGGGVMGALHIMGARLFGTRIILSEPDQARRDFAVKIGANFVIDPLKEDPIERVKQLTDGRGAEVVINTTAIPMITEQAIKMTGMAGHCVIYSSQHPDKPVNVSPNWLHNSEVILTGAVNPPIALFEQAVNLISKEILDPSILVTEMIDYTHAKEAFEKASRSDTYRIVITF